MTLASADGSYSSGCSGSSCRHKKDFSFALMPYECQQEKKRNQTEGADSIPSLYKGGEKTIFSSHNSRRVETIRFSPPRGLKKVCKKIIDPSPCNKRSIPNPMQFLTSRAVSSNPSNRLCAAKPSVFPAISSRTCCTNSKSCIGAVQIGPPTYRKK